MAMTKLVYSFNDGNRDMREVLGGKGANLSDMTNLGLPVPPGFTVSTNACNKYFEDGQKLTEELINSIKVELEKVEKSLGKKLGGSKNPLLVSVRSGAPVSMPGMMDTILNLGLNDETVEAVALETSNRRFAFDCYRRFIQMYGDVVLGVPHYRFERKLESLKQNEGVTEDTKLKAESLKELSEDYKAIIKKETGEDFPQDPKEQLLKAVEAVFASWNNQRAKLYRQINKIPDHYGTAVNVQAMVYGNMGETSGTGVLFTRNPSTGENKLYGEFLVNAQGEDVVAGIRTPKPILELEKIMPEVYKELNDISYKLEKHYRDVQDIEFTIEQGRLFMLQTRNAKRTAAAAVKIAVDMVNDNILTKDEAILRVDASQLDKLLHRQIDDGSHVEHIATGLPASPGAATGALVFSADNAEKLVEKGKKVILIRPETTPDDIHGIVAAEGILTQRGGMTSHAAVVARGMGKPCVCGCEALNIDIMDKNVKIGEETYNEGDIVTIDGATGNVISGTVKLIDPELSDELITFLGWADDVRQLNVRTNADTPEDANKAREYGAEGIGLCRTEHMFMAQDRLPIVQQMILSDSKEKQQAALDKLLPFQKEDFYGIFKAMAGLPVTIRLLDPPLHEFLPNAEELAKEINEMKSEAKPAYKIKEKEQILKRIKSLHESNPMLGHRGCRLAIVHPEIYDMQVHAIFSALEELKKEGIDAIPEIMIPLVGEAKELKIVKDNVLKVANQYSHLDLDYKVGTMIELPRACVTADEIAEHAEFFSFGTNDLTQTTFGYSRDDAEGKFLPAYIDKKILPENPFVSIDEKGVGVLVDLGVAKGRKVKKNLKIGICGEHGGDPQSINFCQKVGLDYVSCSPFRVPIARLAAAQSYISQKK
ncbi:pyruvate, phosphate dikinase [Proteinivorax hydrogeniformans]|uniref:Pyruvate, phosphate dikinase n=1 Tax=Proteinivorax hydrogeniformans TaxID=1826727 RepID=A0AAU8HQ22_9FIRM